MCVLVASRTSGESRATIIVGLAMRGAACVAVLLLACNSTLREFALHTQPSGRAIAVEIVDLGKSLVCGSGDHVPEIHTSILGVAKVVRCGFEFAER